MNGDGKSDRSIVPKNSPNKGRDASRSAEGVEERDRANGNSGQQTRHRAQNRACLQQALDRVRQAAKKDRKLQFTTLWHHVYEVDHLRASFYALKRKGVPGVDGVTWQAYAERLEDNLQDLSERLRCGAYRAKPVKRAYIQKPDGRQRPLGVPTLEDKLVQRTTAQVLSSVYETDFLGFSYGFRPGRSQHNALDAVSVGIHQKKVSWVLDADVCGFFDAIDHDRLVEFIERRIADQRVIRHIKKWLNAGVLEDGKRRRMECGTPQGGSISPLLANIYLHYVLDVWTHDWRKTQAQGDVMIVRYADDFIVGFQHRADGERFLAELKEHFRFFGLELHEGKTRLIEFGRFAAENRRGRGDGKPETFDFLGFTHYCGTSRKGRFIIKRKTVRRKLTAKLKQMKRELRKRLHDSIPEVGKWLRQVVTGHDRYYGVPGNIKSLKSFRFWLARLWLRSLRRRSQKHRTTWVRMMRLMSRWFPPARIYHPYPSQRLCVNTGGRSPVR